MQEGGGGSRVTTTVDSATPDNDAHIDSQQTRCQIGLVSGDALIAVRSIEGDASVAPLRSATTCVDTQTLLELIHLVFIAVLLSSHYFF